MIRDGGFFTLLVQFQGKQCFLTYLEDYKQSAAGAKPYLTITMFDDLVETKSLALIRAEVTNQLTRPEAKVYASREFICSFVFVICRPLLHDPLTVLFYKFPSAFVFWVLVIKG